MLESNTMGVPETADRKFSVLIATLLLMSVLCLAGCAYSKVSSQQGPAGAHFPVRAEAVAVMLADDASGADVDQSGSGRLLADITLDSIRDAFPKAYLIETARESDAFKQAGQRDTRYVVAPRIIQWANSTGLKSGLSNPVIVELRLYFVPSREWVQSIRYEGRNNSVTIGSHVPEALQDNTYEDAVVGLLKGPYR